MTQPRMSGRLAIVNGQSAMSKWSLTEQSSPQSSYTSKTGLLPNRTHGPSTITGTIDADGGIPRALPGQTFTFEGYIGPNSGVAGEVGPKWSGLALVDSLTINFDWTTNKVVNHSISFSAAGAFTYNAAATAPTDVADFVPVGVCGKTIRFTPVGGAETVIDRVKSATLTFSAANGKETNSTTGCAVFSVPGPCDVKLSIAVETPGRQLDIGTKYSIALPYDSDDFFLQYMLAKGYSGLQADRSSGNLIGQTIELEYSRQNDAGDLGTGITLPNSTIWVG